jgi:hypothetical protein
MRSLSSCLLAVLLLSWAVPPTDAQAEFVKPVNYTYDDPVVFNQWCAELTDMYGPTCTCETRYGESNNINGLDLDHEIHCDPLQGERTCIHNVTIDTARVWLKATSIGEEGNFQTIKETAITDFYVFLDETSVNTISFRFNDDIGQRRTGCEGVVGSINCARCGLCDVPPKDDSLEYPVHLGPADIFRGISGFCRYGLGPSVGTFNTCDNTNGSSVIMDILFFDLEITDADQIGPCPGDMREAPQDNVSGEPPVPAENSDARTTLSTLFAFVAAFLLPAMGFVV